MTKRTSRLTRAQKIAAGRTCRHMPATYQDAMAHRSALMARVNAALAHIADSYAYEGDRERDQREELADQTLDFVCDRFGHNGFNNQWSRLIMAHAMLNLLRSINDRSEEICKLIERVYIERHEELPGYLAQRISRIRLARQERLNSPRRYCSKPPVVVEVRKGPSIRKHQADADSKLENAA